MAQWLKITALDSDNVFQMLIFSMPSVEVLQMHKIMGHVGQWRKEILYPLRRPNRTMPNFNKLQGNISLNKSVILFYATMSALISGHVEMLVYALRLVISNVLMLSDSRALQHLNTISITAWGLTSEPHYLQSDLYFDSPSFSLWISVSKLS